MLVYACAVIRTASRLMGLAKVFVDPESKIPAHPFTNAVVMTTLLAYPMCSLIWEKIANNGEGSFRVTR